MPHESRRRRHRSRHSSHQKLQFTEPGSQWQSQPLLVSLTDASLCLTFVLVALGFGGRAAIGQLFLVAGALVTTACWLAHQLTAAERKYTWSGTELLWCAGILVAGLQIVPLPQSTLLTIAPHLKEALPLVFGASEVNPVPGWTQLSLAPHETASALATFAAYGLLFLVVVQRVQTLADAERILCGAAIASVGMACFALAQYFICNDKYFWVIEHPFMTTSQSALGCFTNHNHLAQFLALGIGPLVWWILRRYHEQEQAGRNGLPPEWHRIAVLSLLGGMGITILTILLCFSRGGVLSLGIAAGVSFGLLCRMGLASVKLAQGLIAAGIVFGGIFFVTGYDTLEKRLEGMLEKNTNEGRFVIWQSNIDVAKDFPWLGTGIGTHADAYHLHFDQGNEDSMEYTHAESGYMQIGSESGLCGLAVTLLFIAFSLRICLRALWHSDLRYRAVAAAVLAGLLANIAHAVFDFFWYTPSCMLLLAIQLAAVLRIGQSVREPEVAEKLPTPGFRLPRIVTVAAACGLIAAGTWMMAHKIPSAQAEPDRLRYLYLSHHHADQNEQEEDEEVADDRGDMVIRAAKLDPTDSRLQEAAGIEYLRRFEARQMTSDNPLGFGQVRDVVKSSEFKSTKEMKEWLQEAVGENTRLLQLASRSFRRAIQASPLRSYSYVKLAELGFLNLTSDDDEKLLMKQAQQLRPHDPQVLYQVGRNIMLTGDIDGALVYWREAFARSRRIQTIVVSQLAGQMDPDFFLENLKPDWEALGLLARAYDQVDRKEDALKIWEMQINVGLKRLKSHLTPQQLESTVLLLHEACMGLDNRDLAVKVLHRGLQKMPQSYLIRNRLAWDRYGAGEYAEAAEHLRWCASRHPEDESLQAAAAAATKQALKTAANEKSTH